MDRASGNGAVDCARAEEEAIRRHEHVGLDVDDDFFDHVSTSVSQTIPERSSLDGVTPSRKRKASKDADLVEVLRENTTILVSAFENATKDICSAITGSEVRKKRELLNGELAKLVGLTSRDHLKAYRVIGCSKDLIELFFGLPDDLKEP